MTIGISKTLCEPGCDARINTSGHREVRIRRGREWEGQRTGGEWWSGGGVAGNSSRVGLPRLQRLSNCRKLSGSDGGGPLMGRIAEGGGTR